MKSEFKNGHFNACYGGNTLYEKSTLQGMTKADLIELIECAQHNYEVLLDERNYFRDSLILIEQTLELEGEEEQKMKCRIRYRMYDKRGLIEGVSETEADDFVIKRGFVGIWTEKNETPIPDIWINVNDVLTIKPIKEEEK